jgi:tricorn protease
MQRRLARPLATVLLALLAVVAPTAAQTATAAAGDEGLARLLRQPDIAGDTIVFVYAGDLWVVGAEGGTARRLTSDPGLEQFPKLSPDGRQVAFTGDYSGTRQVHVIDVDGGVPRQLTFYNDVGALPPRGGVDNRVVDWTPDGKDILFLPHRLPWSERMGVHYVVPAAGGMERPIGIPEGSGGSYSPDGSRLAYTPIEREFRTWKRYQGGRAQDVWIFDLAQKTAEQITTFAGTDNQPVWVGNSIYYTSDDGGTLNVWGHDLGSGQKRQMTRHGDFDALWPSGDSRRIVYEHGGFIRRLDPATGEDVRVPIRLTGDFASTVPRYQAVAANIDGSSISPSGARALFAARGDLFTVPAAEGEARNLTATPGVRERSPAWSPDGRQVAYWSDATGEYELYVRAADGSGEARQLTTDAGADPTWRFGAVWSPDGKRLAFGDHRARLRVVDAASGAISDVDRSTHDDITDYTWSPDGRWLAYSKTAGEPRSAIWAWSADNKRAYQLTSDDTTASEPVWDPKGRYLYFLSNRDFNMTFSGFEFDFLYTAPTRVYVATLSADAPALFLPESDEEKPAGDADGEPTSGDSVDEGEGEKAAAGPARTALDPAGFEQRVRAIPGAPGSYASLAAVEGGVLYLETENDTTSLRLFDIEAKEEKTVLADVDAYQPTADGKKLLWRRGAGRGATWGIADLKPGLEGAPGKIDLAGLEAKVDPRAEWRQEFVEGWRMLRDWFYDPAMHGLDWQAMRRKYEPLVDHLAHRTDLDYILGELGGELESGHMYVDTAQGWQVPRRDGALLGAEVVADPSGHFRIAKIFAGENWHEDFRSPLTEPGVDVREGDLILAVDGIDTRGVDNFYRLLENKGHRVVTLRVAASAGAPAREARVRPITQEGNLRYLDWVASRRQRVTELSGGRIGYIHLPNTGTEGNRELYEGFYAQSSRDALIFDDRYNGGGFIPFHMIELLQRPLLSYWARRDVAPFTTPDFFHRGPKAVLINGYSASGGDAFPYYFRQRGMGTILGTRTWGGLIGNSGNPRFMDGGGVNVPRFRFIDPEGMWAVEGEGVSPDIEVVDRPDLVARGEDPTLERAVQLLLEELEKSPPRPLTVPPAPRARAAGSAEAP